MKVLPIEVQEGGQLRLPRDVALPANARLAVLVFEPTESTSDESGGALIATLAEQSGALDLLKEEPEIYSDTDILAGRSNPSFRR